MTGRQLDEHRYRSEPAGEAPPFRKSWFVPKIVLRFCRLTLRRPLYFQGTSLRIVYGKIFALYKEVCLVMIYHICRRGEAEKAFAAGVYAPDSLQTEGFIHFSTAAQVVGVANRFYAAEPDLVLLIVDDTNAENSEKVKFEAFSSWTASWRRWWCRSTP